MADDTSNPTPTPVVAPTPPPAPDALTTLLATDAIKTAAASFKAVFETLSPDDVRWVHLNAVRTGLRGLGL